MNQIAQSQARASLFALIATWLARSSKDVPSQFPNITLNAAGYRQFTFELTPMSVVNRAPGDLYITPGVNVYFGDDVADARYAKPQIWHLPVMIHIMVAWTEKKNLGQSQAQRLGGLVEEAFEGLGAQIPMFDFSVSSPAPVPRRFVTWAHRTRGSFREAGDPFRDIFTNLILTREFRYSA